MFSRITPGLGNPNISKLIPPPSSAGGSFQLLAIPHHDRRVEQRTNVILRAPRLRHAPLNVQQGVNCLHRRPYRVFDGEDDVPRVALGELPQEPEVDRSLGHYLRPVAVGPGQEEGRDVGHHTRMHVHRLGRQLVDLIVRHPQVVEPFTGDLLAGALTHRLRDVVAGPVEAVGAVAVDHQLVLRRVPEVRVALDVPRQHPIGIAHGYQATGDGARVELERVALADPLDVGRNLVVEGDDACRLIAALVGVGTELVGSTEGGVLGGDVAPHRPDAALLDVPDPLGRGVMVPPGGVFYRRSVGN